VPRKRNESEICRMKTQYPKNFRNNNDKSKNMVVELGG
jgi:hypothetical protein